jgi:hypothetical protein
MLANALSRPLGNAAFRDHSNIEVLYIRLNRYIVFYWQRRQHTEVGSRTVRPYE